MRLKYAPMFIVLLLLAVNILNVYAAEYKAPLKKGDELKYKVLKATGEFSKIDDKEVKEGDIIKYVVTDVKTSEYGGDKYDVVVVDVYLNDEKVESDVEYMGGIYTPVFPSIYLYTDDKWIEDNVIKPCKDAGLTVEGSGGNIKVSGTYKYEVPFLNISMEYEVSYEFKDYILTYYHIKYEEEGKTNELEMKLQKFPWVWVGVGVAIVVIVIVVVFFLFKKKTPA